MFPRHRPENFYRPRKQQGAALMVMLVILVLGASSILVSSLSSSGLRIERDKITSDALAQAKEALIGYAVKVEISNLNNPDQWRPGDLPCPDMDNDGDAEGNCGNADGSTGQDKRLGRLPWKTLGLPDLRDGSGERLWYAVSNSFKNNTRAGALNSDTPGTITVRSMDGNILHDASIDDGVVTVIISPGAVLLRADQAALQDRSNAGENIAGNYLDVANGEDNAGFADGMANGFIHGSIKDINGNVILNDQLLAITQDDMMRPVQKRVAGEVKQCLIEYAAANHQRYPWAVPLNDLVDYQDKNNQVFGRIPDDLNETGSGGTGMDKKWGGSCNTHKNNAASTWWQSWRETVFYALAKDYQPGNAIPVNTCAAGGQCLSVNPPAAAEDKKFVVIVAGKKLAGQSRSPGADKENPNNYLEAPNRDGDAVFASGTPSANFNDTVVFE